MRLASRVVLLAPALLLITLTTTAQAQKNCTKGILCGRTCISATKTCRIGSYSSPPPEASPARASTRHALVAPDTGAAADTLAWVALPAGEYYYRASCQAAQELPNPVRFTTAQAAEERGLRRSRVPGC
jgi:hypothetical protein